MSDQAEPTPAVHPGEFDQAAPEYAIIHVKETSTCDAWPVAHRVSGGWQTGVYHYDDEAVLAITPLHVVPAEYDTTLDRVRAALGTPPGRAVSIHAAEVVADLATARAETAHLDGQLAARERRIAELEDERDQLRERKQVDLDDLKRRLGIAQGTLTRHCVRRDEQDAEIERLKAERDERQARIDEVVKRWPFRFLLGVLMGSQEAADEHLAQLENPAAVRAALQGEDTTDSDFVAPRSPTAEVDARRDVPEIVRLRRERDELLWLHAEAVHFGHGWHDQWMATRETVHKLQARIDAGLGLLEAGVGDTPGGRWAGYNASELKCIDCSWYWNGALTERNRTEAVERLRAHRALTHPHRIVVDPIAIRAALQGDQPAGTSPQASPLVEPSGEAVAKLPHGVDMRTDSDCLRACLATVTGRPYEDAPALDSGWRSSAVTFLSASDASSGLVIGIGASPRGVPGGHAIVCAPDGTLVHDPHPSRAGVLEMWELWDSDGRIVVDEPTFGRRRAAELQVVEEQS